MKVSKYIFKAVTPVMALFQKQLRLPFKQGYDNLRSTCGESAASADSARSEKHFHRNQSAVCSSHNVPSDSNLLCKSHNTYPHTESFTILPYSSNPINQSLHSATSNKKEPLYCDSFT